MAGFVIVECSSIALSPNLPGCSSLKRRKPYSKRRYCYGTLESHTYPKPFRSSFKCPAWNLESPESRWRQGALRAIATTFPEAWVASEEATAIAAAEEAMALARAAVLAAKQAAQANAENVISDYQMLNRSLAFESSSKEKLNKDEIISRLNSQMEAETEARKRLERVKIKPKPERIDLEGRLERLELEERVEEVEQERAEVEEKVQTVEKNEVEIAVSSKKRKQRMQKRARILEERNKQQDTTEYDFSADFTIGIPKKGQYVPHISRRTRMSPAEELEAVNGIQEHTKMEKLKATMAKQLGREPTFREWADALKMEPRDLRKKLIHIKKCRNMMISSNLGLVIKVARKFALKGSNVEDLIHEGINGLLHGVQKFDTTRGFRLSTYVLWWIELSVRRASVKRSLLCQVPMHLFDMYTRVLKTRTQILQERGEHPTDEEVANIIGSTPQKVHLAGNLMRHPKSLDDKIPGYDNVTLSEVLPDPEEESSYLAFEKVLLKEQLDKVLSMLKPREKEVLVLRYGLKDGRERTLEELSHYFDLSRERVRQVEKRALAKIREMGGKEMLASFVQTFLGNTEL